jgi:hypothetical protein
MGFRPMVAAYHTRPKSGKALGLVASELRVAIGAENVSVSSPGGVFLLAAALGRDFCVHDLPAVRADANWRIDPPVIAVCALLSLETH